MISIRYPGDVRPVDTRGIDDSFDRAFAYGRDIRDERQGNKAFEGYLSSLYGGGQPQQQPMSLSALGGVQREPLAPPMDPASQRVAQAHAASGGTPPQGAIEAYIRHAAQKRGIDPEVALKVAMSEGGVKDPFRQSDVVKDGVREQSYGPFQLYMNGGLGNEALEKGIDPRKDWQGAIDFALDKAKEGGWGPWYGAQKVGITGKAGIGQQGAYSGQFGGQDAGPVGAISNQFAGQPAQAPAAPQGAPSGGDLLPPRDVMLQLFKSKETRPLAIALAQSAQTLRTNQNDPKARLDYEKAVIELQNLRQGGGGDYKVVNDRLVKIGGNGQISDVTPDSPASGQAPLFSGKSTEAEGLNFLVNQGVLTREQAATVAAGKTITGPNGEIIFMTPQGVFSQPAGGGQAQPLGGQPAASGNIPLTEPKITVDEKKAMTFADRMATSGAIIDSMGTKGSGMGDKIASQAPFGTDVYLTSDDFKKVDQAKRDFINAQLRRESGAVIADSEFDNANKQYFPQPNDPPEVLEQKRINRQTVIEGMKRDSGPTYKGDSGVIDWKDL